MSCRGRGPTRSRNPALSRCRSARLSSDPPLQGMLPEHCRAALNGRHPSWGTDDRRDQRVMCCVLTSPGAAKRRLGSGRGPSGRAGVGWDWLTGWHLHTGSEVESGGGCGPTTGPDASVSPSPRRGPEGPHSRLCLPLSQTLGSPRHDSLPRGHSPHGPCPHHTTGHPRPPRCPLSHGCLGHHLASHCGRLQRAWWSTLPARPGQG